jgi:hypothetical protein
MKLVGFAGGLVIVLVIASLLTPDLKNLDETVQFTIRFINLAFSATVTLAYTTALVVILIHPKRSFNPVRWLLTQVVAFAVLYLFKCGLSAAHGLVAPGLRSLGVGVKLSSSLLFGFLAAALVYYLASLLSPHLQRWIEDVKPDP